MKDRLAKTHRTIGLVDQIFASISHGFGFALAILALIIPVVTVHFGSTIQLAAYVIFASSLVFLYLASTLYHALEATGAERVFKTLDHGAIFALIAGTYTPVIFIANSGAKAWIYFGIVWLIAVIGTTIKAIWPRRFKHVFTALYLGLSWMAVFIMHDIAVNTPHGTVALFILGGLSYTVGTYFYAHKRLPMRHTIWHLFVLGGSALHFAAIVRF